MLWSAKLIISSRTETLDAEILGTLDAGILGALDAGILGSLDAGILGSLDAGFLGSLDAGFLGSLDAGFLGFVAANPCYVALHPLRLELWKESIEQVTNHDKELVHRTVIGRRNYFVVLFCHLKTTLYNLKSNMEFARVCAFP